MKLASQKAKDLATSRPNSCRAQLFCAHVKLQFALGHVKATGRRSILVRIRDDMNEAAKRFDGSLVLAMFHAKLCFVLGFYEAAHLECLRAFGLKQPVDPKLEDVPPGSVNGGVYDDRLSSIYQDLSRLKHRLLLVAKAHWCLMTSEKQDGFLSVGLDELHKYYDEVYEDGHWATRTISDVLTSVKKTGSWRFWISPYCIGKSFRMQHSLLEHMYSKHPAEKVLRSVLDPKLSDDTDTSMDDNSLDEISVCKDSEDHYLFQFNKTDNIFERLFCSTPSRTDAKSFAEIQEDKCKEGKEILQKLKQILKNLPTNKLSAEYDKARPEIQCLLRDFFTTSALDYRIVVLTLVKSFLLTKLMKSSSGGDATSKSIDNDDINSIFPEVAVVREVPIEDKSSGAMGNKNNSDSYINMSENRNKIAQKPGTFEMDICCIIASGATGQKYQPSIAKENSASILGTAL
ncbi:uncharacterized protein LOC104581305 isoform X1 [Brachypodium distachyon]|uniref:DUF629 domain-containing protein n=1 Tax=Brachypodium distachyon TaxID=15368 RepID=A0A2K2CMU6_BRADI|nr:uncharacterized protein LOC104581305 isoform X1 [Brachypodium distachyon]PNT63343.1 hypothetical protein BRADI_4g14556v3 [Brachypodium distachyon]|eukprot:XP_010237574.1 uncharacterized protein LOC104581305 isoform X1 [Brachypodium distachyon]